MIHLLILAVHLLATIAKLVRPGGVRAVVAESLVLKQQLLISSRARRRAPNLNSVDRFLLGLGSLFVPPSRIPKLAVILKPRTLFRFHEALKKRKYRWLFSSGGHRRPGPKGPSKELIDAIVEFKRRNPRVGCPRIAQEIAHAFGIDIDKDIVRRVLAKHYRPEAGTDGPSWLSLIGHVKDSLWSVDLFRCESIPYGQKIETVGNLGSYPIPAYPRRASSATFFWAIKGRFADRRARGGGTHGFCAHAGLRHGDGGPGAAGAERISGRRKSYPEGP